MEASRRRNAPAYIPAKITVLATQGGAAVVAFILFLYYVWANKKKARQETNSTAEASNWEDQTDKQNVAFRYVY